MIQVCTIIISPLEFKVNSDMAFCVKLCTNPVVKRTSSFELAIDFLPDLLYNCNIKKHVPHNNFALRGLLG